MSKVKKYTDEFNDIELAETIRQRFEIPSHYISHSYGSYSGPSYLPGCEAPTDDQARRLIVEERLMLTVSSARSPLFSIERHIAGNLLQKISPAGELIYEALSLPAPPPRLPKFEYSAAHDALCEASNLVRLDAFSLTHQPTCTITANGMLEGEAIQTYLDAAKECLQHPTLKKRRAATKKTVAANLRKVHSFINDCTSEVGIIEAIEMELIPPFNATQHTLEESEALMRKFVDCVLSSDQLTITGIATKRCYTLASGYYFVAWLLFPSRTKNCAVSLAQTVHQMWARVAGERGYTCMRVDFRANLAWLARRIQLVLTTDLYVALTPHTKIRHFSLQRRREPLQGATGHYMRVTFPKCMPRYGELKDDQNG